MLFNLLLACLSLGCSENVLEASFHKNIPFSEILSDSLTKPLPLNYSEFARHVGQSKAIKILIDAGVPCSVEFEVLVSRKGDYLEHRWPNYPCHPLAMIAIESYVAKLKFNAGKVNGKPIDMWVKMRFTWKTF
ncbi:MAG: hypothetical protein AAFY71_24945 [Bacteroidota bacterium]